MKDQRVIRVYYMELSLTGALFSFLFHRQKRKIDAYVFVKRKWNYKDCIKRTG